MKSDVKQLPESRIELSVSVEAEEFRHFVDAALEEFVRDAELPGFRKGKAPSDLVRERVGEFTLYERAANAAAKKYFTDIVAEHGWEPIEKPDIEVTKLAPRNPFEFRASFFVLPEVKLPDYKMLLVPLGKEYREPVIADAQVEETLAWLQKSRRTFADAGHAIRAGNRVTVDFSMTENGLSVPDGTQQGFGFIVGENKIVPGFEAEIMGMEKGHEKAFSLALPKDYWNKQIAGKTIAFAVKITNIQDVVLPHLDDAFAASVGKFATLDALRQSVREGMEHEEREKELQKFRMKLLEAIDAKTAIDVPAVLVAREQDMMVHELEHSVSDSGIDWETYQKQIGKTEDQMKTEFADPAKKRVRFALIMRAVAQKEFLEPTKEEIDEEVNRALLQFKTPEQAAKSIDVEELVSYTKSILTNEKVSQFLQDCARPTK